jgi:hypothetical protein
MRSIMPYESATEPHQAIAWPQRFPRGILHAPRVCPDSIHPSPRLRRFIQRLSEEIADKR